MTGEELFRTLCRNLGARESEVREIELTVWPNGQLHCCARANKEYPGWALWGLDGREIPGLEVVDRQAPNRS